MEDVAVDPEPQPDDVPGPAVGGSHDSRNAFAPSPPVLLRPGDLRPGDLRPGDLRPGDLRPGDLRPAHHRPEPAETRRRARGRTRSNGTAAPASELAAASSTETSAAAFETAAAAFETPASQTSATAAPARWTVRPIATGAGLVALLALQALLVVPAPGTHFWVDEALSVGIGRYPLRQIPSVLRLDGNPPLWFMLVHFWLMAAGRSVAILHALTMAFSAAAVPVGFGLADRVFNRRAAWLTAALLACDPFVVFFGREFRMYSLVALLGLIASGAFVLAFCQGKRKWTPVFAAALALLLYTHTWGIFFAAGAAAALVPCLLAAPDRRRLLRDALASFAGVGLLWLPWVPTFIAQASHNGAPWSMQPTVGGAIHSVSMVLGDDRVVLAFSVAGLATLAAAVRRRATPADLAVTSLSVMVIVSLATAWAANQVTPAWTYRYMSIIVGPLLLLVGGVLASSGVPGLLAAVMALMIWTHPLGWAFGHHHLERPDAKSPAADIARSAARQLKPGDLVVSTQPEQVPALAFYLPTGMRYLTPAGAPSDPLVMDWRDAAERLNAGQNMAGVESAIDALRPGEHLLLVYPSVRPKADAPVWFHLINDRSRQWVPALEADGRLSGWTTLVNKGGLTALIATRN